jgi:hypothetical protein
VNQQVVLVGVAAQLPWPSHACVVTNPFTHVFEPHDVVDG